MSARRPVIGICAALERARWGPWDDDAVMLPAGYHRAVQRAGGLALLVAPDPALVLDPDELLDRVDGLLLAGGPDLGDAPERDATERALGERALARDLPLLGVCRGMQLLNVIRGGTLVPHLPDRVGHEDHRRVPGAFGDHDVRLRSGSLAAAVAGGELVGTKSHHHQGVDAVGDGLQVTAHSVLDDLPEAIEDPGRRFALGVQWHPEADAGSPVIGALVAAARARRREE